MCAILTYTREEISKDFFEEMLQRTASRPRATRLISTSKAIRHSSQVFRTVSTLLKKQQLVFLMIQFM